MEKIIIDSHALFWFLTENSKLSKKAKQAIKNADQVIVPSIVLMEVLFILEKYDVAHKFFDVLQELRSKRYVVFPLDVTVAVRVFTLGRGLEMHDRIIVAIARMHTAPIVTKDSVIHKNYPLVIW